MSIKILKGKTLGNAVANIGKKAASFSEALHTVAYGALLHVEEHQCPSHLNKLIENVPANFRPMLSAYAKAFGKVKYDVEKKAFVYNKGAKSDLDSAFRISPADYQRDQRAETSTAAKFDAEAEVKAIESFIDRMEEKGMRKNTLKALRGVLQVAKGTAIRQAAPAKPAKGKTAPKLVVVDNAPEQQAA